MKTKDILEEVFKSRRGDYRLVDVDLVKWIPEPLGKTKRDVLVKLEIAYALENNLANHPYWVDEPREFIDAYTELYQTLFSLMWLHEPSSRQNIVVSAKCCVTLVQYNNGVLHCYSRSTDMKNGYYSDRKMLNYLAEHINEYRPDCKVDSISWYFACPHIYTEAGIARRKTAGRNDKG